MMGKLKFAMLTGLMVLLLSGCNSELVGQLSERQANEIVAMLAKYNIDATKKRGAKNSFSVEVSQDNLSEATELLTSYKLPSTDDVEIAQQFPADGMITTPLGEKARLISAVEQRLGQTIRQLDNVTSTRVHLSYPLTGENNQNSASVLLIYRGAINEEEYTTKIKRFIKNSVQGIHYDNISVVMFEQAEPIIATPAKKSFAANNPVISGLLTLSVIILLLLSIYFIYQRKEKPFSRLFNKPTSSANSEDHSVL